MTFAEKVRKRLREMKKTQGDLAEAIGTQQPQVSSWLNQGVIPSTPFVVKTAKYLRLSIDYLLDDTQEVEVIRVNAPEAPASPKVVSMEAALMLNKISEIMRKYEDAEEAESRVSAEIEHLERTRNYWMKRKENIGILFDKLTKIYLSEFVKSGDEGAGTEAFRLFLSIGLGFDLVGANPESVESIEGVDAEDAAFLGFFERKNRERGMEAIRSIVGERFSRKSSPKPGRAKKE
jgi:transcriptional regulator with XRE-family HTH domain